MNANSKVSEQCRIAASKGNQVLGMIRRNITSSSVTLSRCCLTMSESVSLVPLS